MNLNRSFKSDGISSIGLVECIRCEGTGVCEETTIGISKEAGAPIVERNPCPQCLGWGILKRTINYEPIIEEENCNG